MTELTTDTLNQILKNMPEDYNIIYKDNQGITHHITDIIEVDMTNKQLILKSD